MKTHESSQLARRFPAVPALSLFAVLVSAKVLTLLGRDVPLSVWTPLAYFWQDALVALLFGIFASIMRRVWVSWTIYGAIVFYTAVNVPLIRTLSTPLTWTMTRAARGTLGDSIQHHLTATNLGLIGLVLLVAIALPLLWKPLSRRQAILVLGTATVVVATGPFATPHVDSVGLHRNALVALVSSSLPHIWSGALDRDSFKWPPEGGTTNDDWRRSPFGKSEREDFLRFRAVAKGRNVVIILLESTGARYLRPYGAAEDPMPNLTRLASAGILFENAYSVYPESIKGLFSVLCSRYPAFGTRSEIYARVTTPAIAQVLARAGYRTALFHSGRFMYLGMEEIVQHRGYDTLEDAGAISGNFNSSFGVDEPATVKRMLDWIDSLPRGQPFFLTFLPIAGHHPYDSPEPRRFSGHEEIDRYRNALHFGDAAVGELFTGLKNRGLDTNTVFVIFGDHGEAFGQHEGNYAHTLFIYDENVHVPYLIAMPGLVEEQIRTRRVASLIDTSPTILDLLGLPRPSDYQGQSLLNPQEQVALFFTDYSLGFLGLRDGPWKMIYELESGRSKLFNLCHDADERKDLSRQFPERVSTYRERLLEWSAAQKRALTQRVR